MRWWGFSSSVRGVVGQIVPDTVLAWGVVPLVSWGECRVWMRPTRGRERRRSVHIERRSV